MTKLVVLFAFLALVTGDIGDKTEETVNNVFQENKAENHWALIVAGSNGWYNYRHQADACHAYQIISRHGIPDERIVVMMYDDLAQNEENPTPGIVINHPNGSDVYHGVPKDYTGEDVTPQNFLNILQGKKKAMAGIGSGKVIKSGPNDHIFVNFVDHGAPGLIAFPDDELHARKLMKAIMNMSKKNKYKQMVFYVEACESGSMFENLLPNNISVFATTAANGKESSYACYFDDKRQTYLGDVYSVKWMEDSDQEDLNTETLQSQFSIVKEETNTSHVMEYGDMTINKEPVADFQGKKTTKPIILPKAPLNAVPSEQVPMAILSHKLAAAKTLAQEQAVLQQMKQLQQKQSDIVNSMKSIVKLASESKEQSERIMSTRRELLNYDCYEPVVEHYDQHCFDISTEDYALRHLYLLVNLCEEGRPAEKIMDVVHKVCTSHLY